MMIERAIAMHEGDSIPGFPSVDVFYYLVQPQLEKLREPALDCLNDVYTQLETLSSQIIDRVFLRFPTLRPVVMDHII
jgi:vacuolar protein sorting-associated protein 1